MCGQPVCERVRLTAWPVAITMQPPRDCCADAFRCRLSLPVADMSVAQRHARPLVAQQTGDDRQWNALQHGVAGERMSEVMQAHIFDRGSLAYQVPERQIG